MPERTPYLARLQRHPRDRDVVVVEVAADLNAAMGTFEPARLVPELHGYVMHLNAISAFFRWARFNEVHVVDERATAAGQRTLPVECSNCGQPGRLHQPPTRCPSCGESWSPVTPPGHADTQRSMTTPCPSCHQPQVGRFPFCATCGAPMQHRSLASARSHPALSSPTSRDQLDEPLPLGVVQGEVVNVSEEALP